MALSLSKTGITTGNTVEAFHVTQSIDAFTGTEAYNIVLSGSLEVTGSVAVQGLTNPSQDNVLTYDTTTGQIFYTASSNLDTQVNTGSFITSAQTGSFLTNTSTGSFYVSSSVVSNVITFHLGDGSTHAQTINTGSGGGGSGNVSTTGSVITASHTPITDLPTVPGNIEFTKGDGSTFNVTTGKTWITASGTTLTVPPGNYGVYVSYNGAAQVTLDITGSTVGDEIEVVTGPDADGLICIDYDTGVTRLWHTQSISGGGFRSLYSSEYPTFKLVYTKIGEWNLVRYSSNKLTNESDAGSYSALSVINVLRS
tara:strand:+ start:2603 stop:3535 length:933 start_codon:yes stop_codon:yes gene_type:complete